MISDWGPLGALAGEWEGSSGVDTSYSHLRGELGQTPYRERATLTPFGPVRNGRQQLFGLDYSAAMWRGGDEAPFHKVVGYFMWEPEMGEVIQAIVVPRCVSVLAGGVAAPDAREFALAADLDGSDYGIVESPYLAKQASTLSYRLTIAIDPDGTWSYSQVVTLRLSELADPFEHADRNTLHRVD